MWNWGRWGGRQTAMAQSSNISRRRKTALEDGSTDYLAKRAELVEIAGRQFKNNGFRAPTLAEIGHKAGLDRATVYYYFGSKEELFSEGLRVGVDDNTNIGRASWRERVCKDGYSGGRAVSLKK